MGRRAIAASSAGNPTRYGKPGENPRKATRSSAPVQELDDPVRGEPGGGGHGLEVGTVEDDRHLDEPPRAGPRRGRRGRSATSAHPLLDEVGSGGGGIEPDHHVAGPGHDGPEARWLGTGGPRLGEGGDQAQRVGGAVDLDQQRAVAVRNDRGASRRSFRRPRVEGEERSDEDPRRLEG